MATGAEAGRLGPSGRTLALLLAATQMLAFSDRFLVNLVAQPLKLAFGLSDAQLGLLHGSAFVLVYALALPWTGVLADRGHRRALLLASVVLWSAAGVASGLAASFGALLAARAVLGLGQAAIAPAALSLMARRLRPGELGRGVSLLTAGASLGRSLAFLAGGAALAWLAARGGLALPGIGALAPWQALLVLAALPNLVILVGLWRIVEPPPAPARTWRVPLAWVLRHRAAYGPHFGAAVASVLIGQTLTAWAPAFYGRAHGLTPAASGLHLGLVVLVAAPLGNLAGGAWLDRARARRPRGAVGRTLALGLAAVPVCAAAMTLAPSLSVSLAAFGGLVAAIGFTSPAALAGLQFLTPRGLRGQVSAVFVAGVSLLAFGIGPVLVGAISDRVVGPENLGLAMLAVFGAVAPVGTALALAIRPLRGRRGVG